MQSYKKLGHLQALQKEKCSFISCEDDIFESKKNVYGGYY